MVRAVRGAIQISEDSREAVEAGVTALVKGVMEINRIEESGIISLQFTITKDIRSMNPAGALRGIGFSQVPLFCAQEPDCVGALPRVIRILLTCDTPFPGPLEPVYLEGAKALRPDLTGEDQDKT